LHQTVSDKKHVRRDITGMIHVFATANRYVARSINKMLEFRFGEIPSKPSRPKYVQRRGALERTLDALCVNGILGASKRAT
jgi:hypothetical protein